MEHSVLPSCLRRNTESSPTIRLQSLHDNLETLKGTADEHHRMLRHFASVVIKNSKLLSDLDDLHLSESEEAAKKAIEDTHSTNLAGALMHNIELEKTRKQMRKLERECRSLVEIQELEDKHRKETEKQQADAEEQPAQEFLAKLDGMKETTMHIGKRLRGLRERQAQINQLADELRERFGGDESVQGRAPDGYELNSYIMSIDHSLSTAAAACAFEAEAQDPYHPLTYSAFVLKDLSDGQAALGTELETEDLGQSMTCSTFKMRCVSAETVHAIETEAHELGPILSNFAFASPFSFTGEIADASRRFVLGLANFGSYSSEDEGANDDNSAIDKIDPTQTPHLMTLNLDQMSPTEDELEDPFADPSSPLSSSILGSSQNESVSGTAKMEFWREVDEIFGASEMEPMPESTRIINTWQESLPLFDEPEDFEQMTRRVNEHREASAVDKDELNPTFATTDIIDTRLQEDRSETSAGSIHEQALETSFAAEIEQAEEEDGELSLEEMRAEYAQTLGNITQLMQDVILGVPAEDEEAVAPLAEPQTPKARIITGHLQVPVVLTPESSFTVSSHNISKTVGSPPIPNTLQTTKQAYTFEALEQIDQQIEKEEHAKYLQTVDEDRQELDLWEARLKEYLRADDPGQ